MKQAHVATALWAVRPLPNNRAAAPPAFAKLRRGKQARGYRLLNLVRPALALMLLVITCMPVTSALAQAPGPTSTVEETPSAMVRPHVVRKLPLKVTLSIAAAFLVVGGVLLAFSLRRWHLWNLFDRQYRFPKVENFAARLGGKKSGGRMATIAFDNAAASNAPPANQVSF